MPTLKNLELEFCRCRCCFDKKKFRYTSWIRINFKLANTKSTLEYTYIHTYIYIYIIECKKRIYVDPN